MDDNTMMQAIINELAAEVGNKAVTIANLKAIVNDLQQQIAAYQQEASAADVELLDAPPTEKKGK